MLPQQQGRTPRGSSWEAKRGEDRLRAGSPQQRGEAKCEICGKCRDDGGCIGAYAGYEALQGAASHQEIEALGHEGAAQQRLELGANALARDTREALAGARQCGLERGVRHEAERRDETCRTQGSERILGEALGGGADGAQHARGEIAAAVPRIDQCTGSRIERDGVHGEVAMREIVREVRSRAIGRDVDHPGLGGNRHCPVSDARRNGARDQRENGLGRCGGREIEVAYGLPAERIAYAAADEIRLVAGGVQARRECEDGGWQKARVQQRVVRRIGKGHRGECTGRSPCAAMRRARYKAEMALLRFRAPGTQLTITALLARALPQAGEPALVRAVRAGCVRVADRVVRDPRHGVTPGARVAVAELAESSREGLAQTRVRVRGKDFVVLETQAGSTPADRRRLAQEAGSPLPVIPGDSEAAALCLFASSEAARLRLLAGIVHSGTREERALVETPPWRSGTLETGTKEHGSLAFAVAREREGVAEVVLSSGALSPGAIRETLARAGAAVLGDTRFGGRLVAGGLRLWSARLQILEEGIDVAIEAPEALWPEEPVFPPQAQGGGRASEAAALVVSRATLRALERGHPWVLADRETGDAGAFRAGALVALRGPSAEPGGLARIEGSGALAARIWSRGGSAGPSVEARIAGAIARRRTLLDAASHSEATNAFRLVHGEADGLPGLAIDRLGPCLRVLVTGRACVAILDRAIDATLRVLDEALEPNAAVIEVVHVRERPAGVLECVRLVRGALPAEARRAGGRLLVRERGLLFEVDPGLSSPASPSPGIGLYLDQRSNRERLARRARGGRWLNLFAHTGAFSAALLAAGAAEVVSVDLSAAWLRALEATLERNGLDALRHRSVRGDSRRYLECLPASERFDGIVIDPPTAAAAGRHFWSVRRDLEPLVERALGQLAAEGCLLVCRNDRAAVRPLAELVRRASRRAGIDRVDVLPAPPGEDFPSLAGFPEGDPFDGVMAVRMSR